MEVCAWCPEGNSSSATSGPHSGHGLLPICNCSVEVPITNLLCRISRVESSPAASSDSRGRGWEAAQHSSSEEHKDPHRIAQGHQSNTVRRKIEPSSGLRMHISAAKSPLAARCTNRPSPPTIVDRLALGEVRISVFGTSLIVSDFLALRSCLSTQSDLTCRMTLRLSSVPNLTVPEFT